MTVVLSGCTSGEGDPTVLPPVPSASSTSAPLQVPPEATADTAQGAAAFARFFFAEINRAYSERDPEFVRRLAASECGSCAAVATDIERLQRADHQVAGRRYIVSSAEASPPGVDGRVIVDFRFTDDPYVERDDAKKIVKDFPAQGVQDGQAMLMRVSDEWRVSAIRLVNT